jgi:hypothetical protein
MATGRIPAPAHLFDRFDFFVFLIQARAGNTFPEVADECVFICSEEFNEFHWTGHCFVSPQLNPLLQVIVSKSIVSSHVDVPIKNSISPL